MTVFDLARKEKTPLPLSVAPSRPLGRILHDQDAFETALGILAERDAAFVATVLGGRGPPRLRRRDPGFAGLAWTIVGQQVSTASAAAIYGRLEACLGSVDAPRLAAARDDVLKGCGLSAGKLRTLRAVTAACAAGARAFAALARADAGPAGDRAVQEAARRAFARPARPGATDLVALAERWRPHRGVAAHCLWAYYGAEKARAASIKAAMAPRRAGSRARLNGGSDG